MSGGGTVNGGIKPSGGGGGRRVREEVYHIRKAHDRLDHHFYRNISADIVLRIDGM